MNNEYPSSKIEYATEYAIRELDEYGDSIDPDFFSGRGARAAAEKRWAEIKANFDTRTHEEAVAAIFTKRDSKGSDAEGFVDCDETTIDHCGSVDALVAGSWFS
jgi:hypothetical protein